ncbi:unnamed protein product, partial [Mesorhabditis belari]|uniref:Uncharacterized protein n=1 Tax=Mesorhabditis belari TaxID=2138241 RepID=A0A915FLI6_9BILA
MISSAACAARYGYALAQDRQALPPHMRALVGREVLSDSRDYSSSVESSGASDFHFSDFTTIQPRHFEEPSLERSFEKSFEDNEKSAEFEAFPKKKNFLKPEKKKISCPMLNPWHDAVAHPDSDPECGHGMPGWRAHPSCRCHFLVKDRDEFGCALKFFTRCKLDNFAVFETEVTTEKPWTTKRQFSTLTFRPSTRARPSTTTQRIVTTKPLLRTTKLTTTKRPTTTRRTTTPRPTTTTQAQHFEEEFDDEDDSHDETGPGFDYIMGTRIVPDEEKEGKVEVSLPEEFGGKNDDEDEEEPQFLIGRRIRLHK